MIKLHYCIDNDNNSEVHSILGVPGVSNKEKTLNLTLTTNYSKKRGSAFYRTITIAIEGKQHDGSEAYLIVEIGEDAFLGAIQTLTGRRLDE